MPQQSALSARPNTVRARWVPVEGAHGLFSSSTLVQKCFSLPLVWVVEGEAQPTLSMALATEQTIKLDLDDAVEQKIGDV